MQNRYFGDVGDFGKYGLLRKLSGLTSEGPNLTLGVIWYLVPDEGHNEDGRHISYLQKPEYRSCDPELFDGLHRLLSDGCRAVSKIQKSYLLPSGSIYYDKFLSFEGVSKSGVSRKSARLDARDKWIKEAVETVKKCDIVFLDPDNGFQVKSVEQYANKGPKYVFWSEAEQFADENNSLVFYHHLNRTMTSKAQIELKLIEFRKNLPNSGDPIPVLFKRGSHRVFFVVPSTKHRNLIEARLREMQNSDWAQHLEVQGI